MVEVFKQNLVFKGDLLSVLLFLGVLCREVEVLGSDTPFLMVISLIWGCLELRGCDFLLVLSICNGKGNPYSIELSNCFLFSI